MNDPSQTGDFQPKGQESLAVVPPAYIGRYCVERVLRQGSFGLVYLAYDDQLRRHVSIKVPHGEMLTRPEAAEAYLTEARTVANLNHPNIVPVYDVGSTNDCPIFILSQFIEGGDLATRSKQSRLMTNEIVSLVATIAETLHYAHSKGAVHGDIKPGNILMNAEGMPFVDDFHLAPREQQRSETLRFVGSPAYMSPEQASGEWGRMDGRSDIFSLGVVFYELLVGRLPFQADSQAEPSERVTANEPRPPMQLDEGVPKELERICLKAMAKQPSERYQTAKDMAADLRQFLPKAEGGESGVAGDDLTANFSARTVSLFELITSQLPAERRQLPSLRQWLSIRWLTAKKNWTLPQRKMMRRAGRFHASRGAALVLFLAIATMLGFVIRDQVIEHSRAAHAAELVQRALNVETDQVPIVVTEMTDCHKYADPLLRQAYEDSAANSQQKLHASLALLPTDPGQVDYLYDRYLDALPQEVPVIRNALEPYKDQLTEKLWAVLEKQEKSDEIQQLRAAAALAKYSPDSERWGSAIGLIVHQLTSDNPAYLHLWMEAFLPIKGKLVNAVVDLYRDENRGELERTLAASILAEFADDQPKLLAELLLDSTVNQFSSIYLKFKDAGDECLPVLMAEIDRKLPPEVSIPDDRREKLAKRQANAAVALLKMNQPAKVWQLLAHRNDPRLRSYLIHRLGPLRVDAAVVLKQLNVETDITIRRALLLSLGEFGENHLSAENRNAFITTLQEMYRTESDPGIHSASEWLLRLRNQEEWLKQLNKEWASDKLQRQKRLEGIEKALAKDKEKASPQWYVNLQGQTFVVIPGPVEFVMGSPSDEGNRRDNEVQHKRRIGRTFAIAAKPVTVEQYREYLKSYSVPDRFSRTADLPAVNIDWHMAANYCNWLSKEERIDKDQWCYETDNLGQVTKLKDKYLSLTGYRLPTEAEMEYATRSGAATARHFGATDELLPKYAWYSVNSQTKTWPVGSLKPNDLGLFDVQGNVFTWCQESYKAYPVGKNDEVVEDKEDGLEILRSVSRVLRGSSYNGRAPVIRASNRTHFDPVSRSDYIGFRIARTFVQ